MILDEDNDYAAQAAGSFVPLPTELWRVRRMGSILSNTMRVQRSLLDAGLPTELTTIGQFFRADGVGLPA